MATSTIREPNRRLFLGCANVTVSKSLASGASGTTSTTFTVLDGADSFFPAVRYCSGYGVPTGAPTISGTSFAVQLTNTSSETHTVQVGYTIFQFKDL